MELFFNIYGFTLVALLVLGIVQVISKKRWIGYIAGIYLGILAGMRGFVGTDTPVYMHYYVQQMHTHGIIARFEPGYNFIQKVAASIGLQPGTFFLIFSLVSMALVTHFFVGYTNFSVFALDYYFVRYFMARDMNQIRQAMAVAIMLCSVRFLKEKRLLPFTLIVLLASSFHIVALVMFIPYILINYLNFQVPDFSKKMIYLFVGSVAVSFFVPMMVRLLVLVLHRGQSYLSLNLTIWQALKGLLPLLVFQIGLSILLAFYVKKYPNDSINLVAYIYVIGTALLIAFFQFPTIATRLSSALIVVESLTFIPGIQVVIRRNRGGLLVTTISLFIIFMYYMNLVRDGYITDYLPNPFPFYGLF